MLTAKSRLPIKDVLLFGWMPSFLKCWVYRRMGYRIGRQVSIGFGSVICGDNVELGEGVDIGFLTFLRGRTIKVGPYVTIGSFTILDTPHLEIGEGTKINEQVFVGGLQFPDSRLVVGRNCQIMQMTFINPTRSIVIGDDSGIGGGCLIFGHTSWLSALEGYPVEFDSIEIGRSVSVAWRVFVLPGTRIGDGVMVGANSLVRGTIPDRCLAVGFPARVVARSPEFPKELDERDRERILRGIGEELTEFLAGHGFRCSRRGAVLDVDDAESGRVWRCGLACTPAELAEVLAPGVNLDALVSLPPLETSTRRSLESRGVLWIDLRTKERAALTNDMGEEAVQYLRRHGVRLLRDWAGAPGREGIES